MVIDVVVSLGRGEGSREVSAGVEILVGIGLEEDGSHCKEGCVGHNGKWSGHVRDLKYRGGGEDAFQFVKGVLLKQGPTPGFAFSGEQVEGCDDVGKVGNKFPVEICKSCE